MEVALRIFCQLEFIGSPKCTWIAEDEYAARERAGEICNQRKADGLLYLQWSIDRTIKYRSPRPLKSIFEEIANFDPKKWSDLSDEDRADYIESYSEIHGKNSNYVENLFNML